MIDGFRHGFFSDVSPWTSLMVVAGVLAVSAAAVHHMRIGYKIRG